LFAGYSYQSNQYGLAIDNVAGYELVLPNGTIKYVTPEDKDLWFGLRVSTTIPIEVCIAKGVRPQGGLNNFVSDHFLAMSNLVVDECWKGIVTKFILKSHTQADI
jgi:hypothetical protein